MPHETALIATIAAGLAFAFIGGFAATRMGLPALVGYLLAGVAVGPFTPGFVADAGIAGQLAEIGVILLMFGVGMHFSVRELWKVRKIAVPGALGQIAVATALGAGLAWLWGWSFGAGSFSGSRSRSRAPSCCSARSRTRGTLASPDGRIAVGWLLVEDLVTVLVLVLLPSLAGSLGGVEGAPAPGVIVALSLAVGKVAAFVAVMLLLGGRVFPWLLNQVARTKSRELFTLAASAIALGVAFVSAELFGVSFALGAFFAGVVVNQSDHSHRAAADLQPLQDAFGVLFFVAVGMLFDPAILVHEPLRVLAVVAVVILGKSAAAFLIVRLFGHSRETALTVSAALAQIGEFSFILAGLGLARGLLPREGQSLILAAALISMTLNPFIFRAAQRLGARLA